MHKEVLVNPAPGLIGQQNTVLSGRERRYDVRGFASPLSIKSVIRGSATWTTAAGRFVLEPGSALIVNGGEEYDLTIDALQLVETTRWSGRSSLASAHPCGGQAPRLSLFAPWTGEGACPPHDEEESRREPA